MKKTFYIYLSVVIICLIGSYATRIVEAQNKLSQPAEVVEGEVKKSDEKDEEVTSSQEIEEQVEVEEKAETKVEEGGEKIEEQKYHVIVIPERAEVGSSQFQPEVLTVKVNEKIVWINNDSRTHFVGTMVIEAYPTGREEDVVDDEEEEDDEESSEHYFTSGYLAKGERFEYSFDTPGTYIYYCFTHPMEMKAEIIVVADK